MRIEMVRKFVKTTSVNVAAGARLKMRCGGVGLLGSEKLIVRDPPRPLLRPTLTVGG